MALRGKSGTGGVNCSVALSLTPLRTSTSKEVVPQHETQDDDANGQEAVGDEEHYGHTDGNPE